MKELFQKLESKKTILEELKSPSTKSYIGDLFTLNMSCIAINTLNVANQY